MKLARVREVGKNLYMIKITGKDYVVFGVGKTDSLYGEKLKNEFLSDTTYWQGWTPGIETRR